MEDDIVWEEMDQSDPRNTFLVQLMLMEVIFLDFNFDILQCCDSFHSCLYKRHEILPLIYSVYKMSLK